MPTFDTQPVKEIKKRKSRAPKEEEIDYSKIPGIIVAKNAAEEFYLQVYGQRSEPKVSSK